jgi:phosphohistidine phosphatase SixA
VVGAGVVGGTAAATGADDGYQRAKESGADQATAMQAADGDALVSGLISLLPGGTQIGQVAGKLARPLTKFLGDKLTAVIAKGAANSVIGATQATAQQLGTNIVAKSTFDPARPWYENLSQPSVPGAIGNLFLGALAHAKGGDKALSPSREEMTSPDLTPVMQAARSAQAVISMLAGAKDSQLRSRDGGAFGAVLDQMVTQHGADPLQISAPVLQNYLLRQDVDGLDLIRSMPSVQAQLPTAIATGRPVSIPIPEFVQALAGNESAPLLALHVKPTADAPSLADLVQGLKGLHQDAGDIGIPTVKDPLTTEQNPAPHGLSDEDAAQWAKDRAEYRDPLKVVAKAVVNNEHYLGTNPMARSPEMRDQQKATIIADHIAAKKQMSKTASRPNGNMGDAHAELEALQKAYENNNTQGQDMTMTVLGKKVCHHCTDDTPLAAESAGLKSLTIENVDEKGARRVYYWEPGTRLKLLGRY